MNVTSDSAAELVDSLASTLDGSIEQVQTEENLDRVTNVLEGVVGLLDEGNFTVDESVRKHILIHLCIAIASCKMHQSESIYYSIIYSILSPTR